MLLAGAGPLRSKGAEKAKKRRKAAGKRQKKKLPAPQTISQWVGLKIFVCGFTPPLR
jgi:hypothetical protein